MLYTLEELYNITKRRIKPLTAKVREKILKVCPTMLLRLPTPMAVHLLSA